MAKKKTMPKMAPGGFFSKEARAERKVARGNRLRDKASAAFESGDMSRYQRLSDRASRNMNKAYNLDFNAATAANEPRMNVYGDIPSAKKGGSLKPVPPSKQKSLGKLPTPVRNKMGFQKKGGAVKRKK